MSLITRDPSGQLWQWTINTDGSGQWTAISSGFPTNADNEASVTLQSVVNLCQTHVELMPLAGVGGFTQEPALSLCNDTIQELLAQPLNWKFNSNDSNPLILCPGRQEFKFAGASAFTKQYAAAIDLSSNNAITESGTTVTVKTLEQHFFSVGDTVYLSGCDVAAYNSTFTQTPSSSGWSNGYVITAVPDSFTFKFTHSQSGLGISGAAGIYDFGWLECGEMTDTQALESQPYVWDLTAVRSHKLTGETGRPSEISIKMSAGGVLTIRVNVVPFTTVWGVILRYQMKAPVKSDLSQTWAPFPDQFGFVYRQMFLARCYRYLDHKRADAEAIKAQAAIARALGRDDNEASDMFVSPETSLMGGLSWQV